MPLKSRLAKRFVKLNGIDVTLRTFTASGTDSQGDTTYTHTDTTVKAIKSFGTSTRMPERLYTSMGDSRPMDYEFFMLDDDAPDQTETTGKLPEIHTDKREFRILEVEDMRIGVQRLLCESLRT